MSGKLPFHMIFPFSDNIGMEAEDERDADLLKHLYPETARRIWPEVEETCDRLEYDGSIMFDECPDKNQIFRKVLEIQERVEPQMLPADASSEERKRFQDLIEMLLYQEMHRRRRRRRRHQRHFVY